MNWSSAFSNAARGRPRSKKAGFRALPIPGARGRPASARRERPSVGAGPSGAFGLRDTSCYRPTEAARARISSPTAGDRARRHLSAPTKAPPRSRNLHFPGAFSWMVEKVPARGSHGRPFPTIRRMAPNDQQRVNEPARSSGQRHVRPDRYGRPEVSPFPCRVARPTRASRTKARSPKPFTESSCACCASLPRQASMVSSGRGFRFATLASGHRVANEPADQIDPAAAPICLQIAVAELRLHGRFEFGVPLAAFLDRARSGILAIPLHAGYRLQL